MRRGPSPSQAFALGREETASCQRARCFCSGATSRRLASAAAGRRFGQFHGVDRVTTRDSERLLRLLVAGLELQDIDAGSLQVRLQRLACFLIAGEAADDESDLALLLRLPGGAGGKVRLPQREGIIQ